MTIVQQIKNLASRLQFKIALIFRGETFTTSEASLAFNIKQSEKENVVLKMHEYPELNNYFLGFLNSAAIGGKIVGDNLAFVVGPEGIGKTTLIENALAAFRKIKTQKKGYNGSAEVHRYISPEYYEWQTRTKQYDNEYFILINNNYRDNPSLNFSGFLDHLHESIISELLKLNSKLSNRVLDANTIKDVLLAQNAQEYMFVYMKDVVYAVINGCDPLYLEPEYVDKLISLNEEIIKLDSISFFNGDTYGELIQLLSKGLKVSAAEAAIRLFLSVGKRIEYQHRDEAYVNSWYQTGIESTNVLLDLLNFVCGFGKLNRQTAQAYFAEQRDLQPSDNWVKSGNRADVAICLTNLDSLYIWDTPQLCNFLDHIISRTAAANGVRNHFPIIIQLPSSADVEDLLTAGQFELGTIPFIEVPGYLHHTLPSSNLSKVLPPKIIQRLFLALGKSPQVWAKAIEQLGNGVTFKSLINGDAEFIKKEGIKAQAKLNRVFTSVQAQQGLCDGSVMPELVQHLRLFRKSRGMMVLDRPGIYIDFVSRPLFQALQREGLAYHYFYLPYLDLTRLFYLPKVTEVKNGMFRKNWYRFLRWRWQNRSRFSIYGSQVKYKEKFQHEAVLFEKFLTPRSEYPLGETYYGGRFNYIYRYARKGVAITYV